MPPWHRFTSRVKLISKEIYRKPGAKRCQNVTECGFEQKTPVFQHKIQVPSEFRRESIARCVVFLMSCQVAS
ncbi:hypothetical protein CEE69_03610 [Rhodopirellula bahusiensis]|uniref:Uncharacterized protein n=1 Tax=Rhodopirellula bahusiensis TaxID=2014065 RepID=A0A2G1WBS5_9BACT|nr:hypothetical protein CEE69_03610 [Rhodopirellula bahusiensis]